MKYNLEHLTQDNDQRVSGPVQDDEALFLYALVRGNRLQRILEIGGLTGYSARNFCAAVSIFNDGIVYTCECAPMQQVAGNHRVIQMDVAALQPHHVDNLPLDLIFFDSHAPQERNVLESLASLIHYETVLAIHDTNLIYRDANTGRPLPAPWQHQPVECKLVNYLHSMGYDAFSIRTLAKDHNDSFVDRKGLTVMQKFRTL